MTTKGNLLDLGIREFNEVLTLQRKLVEERSKGQIPDTLILVEHPHVFTVGKGVPGEVPNRIDGVPVFRIERGGQWTYHGPGQLVGYPILDLNARNRDIHGFLQKIEDSLMQAIGKFGIVGGRGQQTGVWVGNKKVASIGAAIRNWTSFHGFALNVNTNLEYFYKISPCGFSGSTMTSMKAILGADVDFNQTKKQVQNGFEVNFELQLTELELESLEQTI
ncbi:MAG TPA: lipoyl(octanoyl) transferase LipB [Candidatus Acidoferrales bacterium]|nr:lipoyl(octanoyl) transferase LipB [Candidatus Acidoferrales bacterium]